jgi:hypothetical protein
MGIYPGKIYDLVTSGFDLSAALSGAAADLDYSTNNLRAIECVGAAGNIIVCLHGDTVNLPAIPMQPGDRWVGSIRRVVFAGTTATGLIGLR